MQTDRNTLLELIDAGADLVPLKIGQKAPRDNEWTTRVYSRDELRRWVERGASLGVRIGRSERVLDIDPRRDPHGRTADDILEDLELAFACDLSSARRVRTGSDGLHVYLTANGETHRERLPGEEWASIELKSPGRQVVAPGSLHPSGTLYRLENAGPAAPLPPALSAALVRERTESAPAETISLDHLKRLLDQLDPHDYTDGRQNWLNVLMEVHSASGGSLEAFDLFCDWSARDENWPPDPEGWLAQWERLHGDRPGDRTLASLLHRVMEAGGNPGAPAAEDFDELPALPEPNTGRAPVPLEPFDESALPKFPWLIEGLLAHGTLTVLIAKGGTGKSLFALHVAYMAALGTNWGYWSSRRPARVLIVAAEDDIDEQRRRAAATRHTMGIEPGAIGDAIAVEKAEALLERTTPGATPRRTDFWKYLRQALIDGRYDVLVCDPMIKLGLGLDENSNTDQDAMANCLRDLAAASNCCVLAVHHSTKAGKNDQDASRGGSALVDASRASLVLNDMSLEEAKELLKDAEQEEYWRFTKITTAKSNYSPKFGGLRWLRKNSVVIGNGDERPALVPWEPVGDAPELSPEAASSLLTLVATASSSKKPYTAETFANAVKAELNCSLKEARAHVAQMVSVGTVREQRYTDPNTKRVKVELHLPHEQMPDEEQDEWSDL